jgi:hypothetical protein
MPIYPTKILEVGPQGQLRRMQVYFILYPGSLFTSEESRTLDDLYLVLSSRFRLTGSHPFKTCKFQVHSSRIHTENVFTFSFLFSHRERNYRMRVSVLLLQISYHDCTRRLTSTKMGFARSAQERRGTLPKFQLRFNPKQESTGHRLSQKW